MNDTQNPSVNVRELHAFYNIHDFWAGEDFDDPKYNTKPHGPDSHEFNGHNHASIGEIDPSLEGKTVREAVEFIAERDGRFRKEHSLVRGIEVSYIQDGCSQIGEMPITLKLSFERYMAMGRPYRLKITATPDNIEQ